MIQKNLKVLIVGGCFPVQGNIPKEKLYHQLLKKEIEDKIKIEVEINILQYEKLNPVYKKIDSIIKQENIDLIIFHLRIEQVLRIIKFYLRYHTKDNRYHQNINMAVIGKCLPETQEFCLKRINDQTKMQSKSALKTILINLNYFLGYLVLNQLYVFKKYKSLSINLIELERRNNVRIIFTGPVSRPIRIIEHFTSYLLDVFMDKAISNKNGSYIKLWGKCENNIYLFCDDNIKVNEFGHKRVSEIIFKYLNSHFYSKQNIFISI